MYAYVAIIKVHEFEQQLRVTWEDLKKGGRKMTNDDSVISENQANYKTFYSASNFSNMCFLI